MHRRECSCTAAVRPPPDLASLLRMVHAPASLPSLNPELQPRVRPTLNVTRTRADVVPTP